MSAIQELRESTRQGMDDAGSVNIALSAGLRIMDGLIRLAGQLEGSTNQDAKDFSANVRLAQTDMEEALRRIMAAEEYITDYYRYLKPGS